MPMPNRAKKRDANEAEIVEWLRAQGVRVDPLDTPFDLLCRYRGFMFGAEIKNPKGRNRMTKDQDEWFTEARKHNDPVFVLRSVGDAAAMLRSPMLARDMAR